MRRLLVLFAFAAILLAATGAMGRPGGGGSYQGGGRGGSTGGGMGGGGFVPLPVGPSNTGPSGPGNPLATVVLLAVVAVVVVIVVAQNRRRQRANHYDPMAATRPSASLAPLQGRDPALTEQSIFEHVHPMSAQLRDAWCAGEMLPARAFVSDGVYSRFQVQLALMRQENRRNVMADARVMALTIEAVEDAAPLDVVHVRLTAQARDTEVPWTADAQHIQAALARAAVEPYTEIWTLVRCSGAQTKPGGFAVGQACPKCGAPLAGGEMIKCRYCGALVCSGEYDWVLGEITQLEEWRPGQARPQGVDALRVLDPAAAAEVLEDRASYLFWKWVQAGRAGSAAPMRKCAAPAFVASGGAAEWTRGASDVAVGAAEVAGCSVGGPDGFDRVDVLVKWSARFNGAGAPTPQRTVVRMARRAGVRSKLSMTAVVCQACGAGLTDSDTTKCDHCGGELAAGDQAWVLEGVSQG